MHGSQPLPQQASKSGAGGGWGMGSEVGVSGGTAGNAVDVVAGMLGWAS